MKLTPTETRALERAKGLKPMTDADRAALPADSVTWTPLQRRRYRETRLCYAAEALDRRELRNSLYRHAISADDPQGKRDYRVTALETSTARLRSELVSAYRDLLALDDNPLFGHTVRTPRTPRTTQGLASVA